MTHSEKETHELAKKFASKLKAGSVLAFEGNLGSGKTTFIKGVALGLGLKKEGDVTSPTFSLMNIYPTKVPLYHFDLYRLDSPKEIMNIGFEEFVNNPGAISCIEWAEKAQNLLPAHTLWVHCNALSESSREYRLPQIAS